MAVTQVRTLRLMFWGSVLFTGVGSCFLLGFHASANEAKDARLKQLLNEKLAILQHVVAQREEMHKHGMSGPRELYESHVALQRAKLELCTTDAERITVLEDLLTEAKRREKMELHSLKQAGGGLPEGPFSLIAEAAQVDRLNIEIEVERLKIK